MSSRIPSIYSLVDPAPYPVDLDEDEDDNYDDYDPYLQLDHDDHLDLPSSPPPYSPQPVSSSSAVESLQGSDEQEVDSVHGAYETLTDNDIIDLDLDDDSDASIFYGSGEHGAVPYSDSGNDGGSINESSDLQSQSLPSSIASPDGNLASLSVPSSPVSAASPSSLASLGSPGSPDSDLVSGSAADLHLHLDLDLDRVSLSGSASALEQASASASSSYLDYSPDRVPHQRPHRQPQADLQGLPRRVSSTPDIRPNRQLPETYHYQQPRLDNPSAPLRRRNRASRAGRHHLDDFSSYVDSDNDPFPDRQHEPHRHPRVHARDHTAHLHDPFENDDIFSQINPHLSSPEVDLEDQEEELQLREHLRLGRARRAARVAREADRRARRSPRDHRPQRPHLEDWGPNVESDYMSNMDFDDELVEVVYQGSMPAPLSPLRGQPSRLQQRRQQRQQRHQPVDVIDLTEEPDSPVHHRHQPVNILRHRPHFHDHDSPPYRNPRRHIAQNGRTPSLNRSDGSILNGNAAAASVIDLTIDSPEDNIPANRRLPPPAPAPAQRDQHNHLFGRNLMGSIRGLLPGLLAYRNLREADIQFIGAAPAVPMNANPLAGNPPDFNYQANGFGGYGGGRQPTPKPDFEAPPPARAGFTRDTGPDKVTDEEQVFVCPSCDNELKYSLEEEDDNGGRPAKKARTKKDREEHHFWAVKACGHVSQVTPTAPHFSAFAVLSC